MPRAYKAMLVIFALIVAMFFLWLATPARSHEAYTDTHDPVIKLSCCGGSDCAPVPIDVDWVTPVKEGFHVVLTLEQAQTFNKNSSYPIDTVVPWPRVQALTKKYDGPPAFYHICIVSGELRCLFVVPST